MSRATVSDYSFFILLIQPLGKNIIILNQLSDNQMKIMPVWDTHLLIIASINAYSNQYKCTSKQKNEKK